MKLPKINPRPILVGVIFTSLMSNPIIPLVSLVHAAGPAADPIVFAVLAAAPRTDVLSPTDNNDTTNSNGTEWYFNTNRSMGFAKGGDSVNLNTADVNSANASLRLSWHMSNPYVESGYRAGENTGLDNDMGWTRFIYQSNSLPGYYPSGPQTDVIESDLTGWSLCFSDGYGDVTPISDITSNCTETYLLVAGAIDPYNKVDVKQGDTDLLGNIPGGVQDLTQKIHTGDVITPSLYQFDGTTEVSWIHYKVFISNCPYWDCTAAPASPLADSPSWDSGTAIVGDYTLPIEADYKYIAIFPADDSTGEVVGTHYVTLVVTHTPVERTISDCTELQNINDEGQIGDNFTLTQSIDCSETVSWNEGDGFLPIGNEVGRFTGNFDGRGYSISNLYINRSSLDYVGLFGVIEEGAAVHDLNLLNFNITGQDEVGSLAGALSGTVTNVNATGTVNGYSDVGGLVGLHTAPLGTGSSSPLVFTWNGTQYTYVADVGRGIPRNNVGNDMTPIQSNELAPLDGKYSLKISEEYNEIVYYDELSLTTVDHAPGYGVATSLIRGHDNDIFTYNNTPSNPLQSCTDMYSNDCTDALKSSDDQWSYKDDSNLNDWTMNFGDLSSASHIELIVQGARDYSEQSSSLKYIKVKNAEGNWVDAYTSSQLAAPGGSPIMRVIDLTGKFQSSDYSVKIGFDRTRMNYFAIDTSEQQPVTTNTYHPNSVNLGFGGYTAIDKTYYWNHDYYSVSDSPSELFAAQSGNFTKYGDVTPLLQSTNDQFVVMHHGDKMDIDFDYVAPTEGTERSYMLYSWATFKHADMGVVGRTVNPLPFQGMTAYPYPSDQSYPMTQDNINYLQNWNTRIVTGSLGGSSTIITSSAYVTTSGDSNVGGLVGTNDTDKLITGSHSTGDVIMINNDSGEVGGLVGYNDGVITYSYSSGNVLEGENVDNDESYFVGGLVGYNDNEVTQSYSTGSVIGYNYVGGLAGISYGLIHDSFTRSNTSGYNNNVGGFTGVNYGDIWSSYAANSATNQETEANDMGNFSGVDYGVIETSFYNTDTATMENICGESTCDSGIIGLDTANMKILANFTTELGEGAWDFDTIWRFDNGINDGFPSFVWQTVDNDTDSISNVVEDAAPNHGDGNNDGVLDSDQYNVSSFVNPVTNNYTTLAVPDACSINALGGSAESEAVTKDSGYNYPTGLLSYTIDCDTPGFTATVQLYIYGVTDSTFVLRKYNPDNSSYSAIPGAELENTTIDGNPVILVTYHVQDGQSLDLDHLENGIIVDPVGLGVQVVGVPDTGLGGLSKRS